MRTLLTMLLCALPVCAQVLPTARAIATPTPASGDSTVYLVNQNFEGTGYDNSETWSENVATDGTVNEDYTTEALLGSQSLLIKEGTGGDPSTYMDWGADKNAVQGNFIFQVDAWDTSNQSAGRTCAYFGSSAGALLGSVRVVSASSGTVFSLMARIGSTSSTATVATFSKGDTIYVWWDYSNITDVVNVWWNTTDSKPANGSNWHTSATATISTAARRVYITDDLPAATYLVDRMRVHE